MIAPTPSVLGLFQKRVAGDDALLELANASFAKAGLKAELFADSVESVHHTLSYRPEPFEYSTLHLPRGLDVFEKDHERTAIEFIRAFSGKFSGFVLHDHPGAVEKGEQYASVIQKIASFLDGGSCLFIEYAAGLKFSEYIRLIQRLRPLKNVNSCIDIGHVAL